MVLTLAVYAVVGVLVVTQITPTVRLRWSDGNPALGSATGLLVGGGLSVLLLLVVSAAAVLLTCVAAPLVEEVLFRGLLLESQRGRGTAVAIWLSAIAFAVWHLTPSALRYYALMGALLGWLYTRRGLVCSMAAHVGFNGVLTIAALSVVLSPGATVTVDGLSAQLPSGWRAVDSSKMPASLGFLGSAEGFLGPSGSAVVVLSIPTPTAPPIDLAYDRLSSDGAMMSLAPGHTSLHELRLPSGPAVEITAERNGDQVTAVFIPHDGRSYTLVLHGAGSVKARSDFERILRSLRLPPPTAG
jgi:hypothetical protein